MIQQSWEISEVERNRILSLHESATKKHYLLLSEQQDSESSGNNLVWSLCEYRIRQIDDKYYVELNNGQNMEIPKLSELKGVLVRNDNELKFNYDKLTTQSINVGTFMRRTNSCSSANPNIQSRSAIPKWFCAFDESGNTPVFGQISAKGSIGTGQGQNPNMITYKDKPNTVIQFNKSRTNQYQIEVSISMKGKIITTRPPITPPKEPPYSLDIQSPFEFDSAELTPESESEFKKFIEVIKTKYENVSGDVEVITSASIDADPNEKEKYNMELSSRRSDHIINRIKNESGNKTLNFIPRPIGQTDKFDPGMKFPEVRDNSKTSKNRRLIIKLPKIS
jgi:outer membrane protein OmpA-like peptidoglycan-associated protein